MFNSPELINHLTTSNTISSSALILAEWNQNDPENVEKVGNYRWRPTETTSPFRYLVDTYDPNDGLGAYTGATDSDVEIQGPYDNNNNPTLFVSSSEKMKMLYSLDDCLKPHRPRSGINYMSYLSNSRFFDAKNVSANRPRYYMGSYNSPFKYWTSYRRESEPLSSAVSPIRGVGRLPNSSGQHYIDDANPFVVYKEPVAANKLVVKMQTHVGSVNLGELRSGPIIADDPLYGKENASTPKTWKIQVLVNNFWKTVVSFSENETRTDGSPIIDSDGYVELYYGMDIPAKYTNTDYIDEVANITLLPDTALDGEYYLVTNNSNTAGTVYIWWNDAWETFTPDYKWQLVQNYDVTRRRYIPDLTSPASFMMAGQTTYRDFQYIRGMRVSVETMNKTNSTFDLIEMSPRLCIDVTDRTMSVRAAKTLGSVDDTALPVGGLVAGAGNIEIFNDDESFNPNGGSIISDLLNNNISFSIYDVVRGVRNGPITSTYYVPIKTLYTEGSAPSYGNEGMVSWDLRDMFYYFESQPAPAMMLTDVSLSVAVTTLLDAIGFSNYTFKNIDGKTEPVIPYFFIAPDQNVAEVLQKLAVATQSAMFFDEYNNFVVMFKDYMMPTAGERDADLVLDGDSSVPNIVDVASTEKKIFNSGTINYTERYIQRSVGSLKQANFVNEDQNWIYLPALLWEVSGTDNTRTINDKVSQQSNYALSAIPLKTPLSDAVPVVSGGRVINNVMDFGEGVYWVARNQGYFYANGEIIRYDAVQYNVVTNQGTYNLWISNNDQYQEQISKLSFNGKIFPTGLVRIYAEPYYDSDGNLLPGAVYKHGRGQFGTPVESHSAGVGSDWTDAANVYGVNTASDYLFKDTGTVPATTLGAHTSYAVDKTMAARSAKGSVIKNFLRDVQYTEAELRTLKTTQKGAVQSSALSFRGPNNWSISGTTYDPKNFLSLTMKTFSTPFKHFGTRMRIIGKVESLQDVDQSPVGSFGIYPFTANGATQVVSGGGGGLFFGVNPTTLNGYYVELIALTNTSLDTVSGEGDGAVAHNVLLYKLAKDPVTGAAIPNKLWGGTANIVVDDGTFVGSGRVAGEDISTVYDLSVEYRLVGSFLRIFVYLNGKEIAVVDDPAPLPVAEGCGVFVRGGSYCMFENFFAISRNVSDYGDFSVIPDGMTSEAFGSDKITANQLDKFALSGIVRKTYLSGLGVNTPSTYKMFYEEFGTIMREVSYFDIKYDKAYPALWSQISPTFNNTQGYTVSGYTADSYGARFLVFNATDKALSLDETSGNYLRIQGVAFTQNTTHDLSMDDYFNLIGDTSNVSDESSTVYSSPRAKEQFKDIRINRMKYGKKEFSLSSDYVQTQSAARNLMGWLSDKSVRPRQQIGVEVFNNPVIQLGDIFTVQYTMDGIDKVAKPDVKFVVYNIEYSRGTDGPSMTVYGSEI